MTAFCGARATILLAVCAFAACGKIELGSYGEVDGSESGSGGAPAQGGSGGDVRAGRGGAAGDAGRSGSPSFGRGGAGIDGFPSAGGAGAGGAAGEGGAAGGPIELESPSCLELAPSCGTEREDCCEQIYVPKGTFLLGGSVVTPAAGAMVEDFYLDKYEVTVGRFRNFIADYTAWRNAGHPRVREGEHPLIPGTGWQAHFSESLPRGAEELIAEVDNCFSIPLSTFRSADPDLPMNCVNWYEAFAFCIWDNGRLATEAEWEYAAAGGGENRLYPWGEAPDPSADLAVFACGGGTYAGVCGTPHVGSKPLGAARWGHLDLGGSMEEWGFDGLDEYPVTCFNCANVFTGSERATRGGSWLGGDARASARSGKPPELRLHFVGLRCAH